MMSVTLLVHSGFTKFLAPVIFACKLCSDGLTFTTTLCHAFQHCASISLPALCQHFRHPVLIQKQHKNTYHIWEPYTYHDGHDGGWLKSYP